MSIKGGGGIRRLMDKSILNFHFVSPGVKLELNLVHLHSGNRERRPLVNVKVISKCVALWKEEKAQPAAGGGDFITRPTNNFEKVANAFEIRVGTDYRHPQLQNNF